jgi:hypothetical protein
VKDEGTETTTPDAKIIFSRLQDEEFGDSLLDVFRQELIGSRKSTVKQAKDLGRLRR